VIACHVPLRADWKPRDVRVIQSNIVTERYEAKDSTSKIPYETWGNATLLIDTEDPATGHAFPGNRANSRIHCA
jgi:hypothetical protein